MIMASEAYLTMQKFPTNVCGATLPARLQTRGPTRHASQTQTLTAVRTHPSAPGRPTATAWVGRPPGKPQIEVSCREACANSNLRQCSLCTRVRVR